MNVRERTVIALILTLVAVLVASDIVSDSREGIFAWHLALESFVGFLSISGIFYVLRDAFQAKKNLARERENFSAFRVEAERWRNESRKFIDGLSLAIDQQLEKWGLTTAEKEVALLLLKGLSLKEIASLRDTSEKTARTQSISIYSKAGLAGRSELSAFFLEDLLAPPESNK